MRIDQRRKLWRLGSAQARTITVLILCVLFAYHANAQCKDFDVGKKFDTSFENDALITVLSRLSIRNRIPIGFERLIPEEESRLTLSAKEITMDQIIGTLRTEFREYNFEITDNVLNVTPVKRRDVILERFLGLRIDQFKFNPKTDRWTIRDSIYDQPEVVDFLRLNNLKAAKGYNASNPDFFVDEQLSVKLSGSHTVKTILNNLVCYSSSKLWMLSRQGEVSENLLLSF